MVRVAFAYRVSNAELAAAVSHPMVEAWPQAQDWPASPGGPLIRRAGIALRGEFSAAWLAKDDPCSLAAVLLDGLIGVLVQAPWIAPTAQVTVRSRPCPPASLEWASTTPGELAQVLSDPIPLAHRVQISPSGIEWLGRLLEGAGRKDASVIREILPTLGALDAAAQATHPYDQVVWLWIALEALAPSASVVTLIDGLVERASSGRGILSSLFSTAEDDVRRLIIARRRLAAYDHVSDRRLVAALRAPAPEGMGSRMRLAGRSAVALRHAVVHGDAPRYPVSERDAAKGARGVMWMIVGALLEERLTGSLRPPSWTPGRSAITR